MIDVDGFGVKDVVAMSCSRVDVLVVFAGVERGVVVVADGEKDGVGGSRLESAFSAHEVMCECLLGGLVEVLAAPVGARAIGPSAASPPSRRGSIGVVVAVVGRRHYVVRVGCLSRGFGFVYCSSAIEIWFMVVFGAALI